MTLKLAGCTFGWLHRAPLADALRSLSAHGVRAIELTTAAPHLFTRHFGPYERKDLARLLRALGLEVVSVNPSFADINLVSTNPEIRDISERQLVAEIELAADLGARHVVVIPGRRHALAPAPDDAARAVLLRLATEWDSPNLRLTYDVANALAQEDPAAGVARIAGYLALAHVSDTWRTRWAHTSPGRGEVDFAAFAAALARAGFTGPTVYELADGEDPAPRLAADFAALGKAGWEVP